MYRYETHMHTYPVSRCAKVSPEEAVSAYKTLGFDGIFITNHFIDGNINIESDRSYREKIELYFSDYERAAAQGEKIGIKVFCGIETSNGGTDFLVYGPKKDWYLAHPEIQTMKMSEKLAFLREQGALIIQAHPFREAGYIDHIRLYPRHIDGVEVINANRSEFENKMAGIYAESYGLLRFAESDNHSGEHQKHLAGMESERPITSEADFVSAVKGGDMHTFTLDVE